jgi:hypothetical protein
MIMTTDGIMMPRQIANIGTPDAVVTGDEKSVELHNPSTLQVL